MSPLNSKILAFANGVEYHLASWIAVFIIDRIGRRKLMIFGALGMSASMAVLCGTIYAATETNVVERGIGPINGLDNKGAGFAAAVMLFVYKFVGSVALELVVYSEADDLFRLPLVARSLPLAGSA